MTTKRRALTNFKHLKDDGLLSQATTVHQAMKGNLNFPNPVPDITVLQSAFDDYQERLGTVKLKGGFYEASLKNDSRKALEGVLRQLAFHVNTIADGDLSMILSSGFPLTAVSISSHFPGVSNTTRLKDGKQRGYFRFDFDKVPDALLYEIQVASTKDVDGELEWDSGFNTTSSMNNIITPTLAGVIYYVRVRAVNGKGVGDWSEAASLLAR